MARVKGTLNTSRQLNSAFDVGTLATPSRILLYALMISSRGMWNSTT